MSPEHEPPHLLGFGEFLVICLVLGAIGLVLIHFLGKWALMPIIVLSFVIIYLAERFKL